MFLFTVSKPRQADDHAKESCENIISESEAIRIAAEAENVKVSDLPESLHIREPVVDEKTASRHFQASSDYYSTPDNSLYGSARNSDHVGKNDIDLQVSIVSSTHVSPGPSKSLAASDDGKNEEHQKDVDGGMGFSTSRTSQKHMTVHNSNGSKSRYVCYSCGKSYASRSSLVDHIKTNGCFSTTDCNDSSGPSEAEASTCSVDRHSRRNLSSYVHGSNTEKIEVRPSQADFSRHLELDICKEQALSPTASSSHMSMSCSYSPSSDMIHNDGSSQRESRPRSQSCLPHNGEDKDFMYPCVDCGKPFKNEELMWRHFETSHCVLGQSPSMTKIRPMTKTSPIPNRKSHECQICFKFFSTKVGLQEHLSRHTGAKNFSCQSCDKKFAWRGSLRKHRLRTSCGKDRKNVLSSRSVKVQTEMKCEKATTVSPQRKLKNPPAHNQAASGIVSPSNRKVPNSCRDSEKSKQFLPSNPKVPSQELKLSHSSQKVKTSKHAVIVEEFIRNSIRYQEGFGIKKDMANYAKLGNGPEIGRHVCRVCDNVYKYKSSLKIHLRYHTGEIPYQCRICMERFVTHRNCRKHVLKHAEESGPEELRSALKQKVESKAVQKECNKQTRETVDCLHSPDPPGSRSQSKAQVRCVNHDNSANKGKSQERVELQTPVISSRSTIQTNTAGFLSSRPSTVANAPGTNESDTNVAESGAKRGKRKRNVKYFDLGEYSDIDFSVKKRKRPRNRVVLHSIGESDSAHKEEMHQDQFSVKNRQSWNRKTIDDHDLQVDELNSSTEANFSRAESPFSLKSAGHSLAHEKGTSEDVNSTAKLLFECKICNTKFSSRFVLRRHEVITGHAKACYECPYCKRIYSEGGAYSNHMFVHQRENGMNCDVCGKELQSRTTFLNHMEMHRKNPFNCELCFEWFPTDKKLQDHLDIAHDNQKEFKCKYCKKTFDWQSNYTRHMNKHTNRKEFKCKICHYSFNIISNLKRHMQSVHKGETELSTSTWEAVNPAQVDHVLNRQHQRRDLWKIKIEEGEDPVGTEKRRGRLKALKAENRKKYNCEICNFLCSSRVELTNHLRFAHKPGNDPENALIYFIIEDENFVCQLCGSLIYIRHSLKNHMRKVHQLEITDDDIAGVNKRRDTQCKEKSTKNAVAEKLNESNAKSQNNAETIATRARNRKASAARSSVDSSQDSCGDRMNCSLCKDSFDSKPLLVQHLHNFHKIPTGLEEALIALTRDVSGFQ